MSKKRLDILLVERGLAESRAQAQALVLAGRVPGHAKAGEQVDESAQLEVAAPARFVSRGGEKLAHALDVLGVDPAGRDCLDVGASTGGFTDVLLQRGATRVYALDVGRAQLAESLRQDARVISMERTNARTLTAESLPERVSLVTFDVSFISLGLVLGPATTTLAPGPADMVALVKPQFEAGRDQVNRGVVRDREVHAAVLRQVAAKARDLGLGTRNVIASPLQGPEGNREFLAYLGPGPSCAELDQVIERAVEAAWAGPPGGA